MFNDRELELLRSVIVSTEEEWLRIQDKLKDLNRYDITLKCWGCEERYDWDEMEDDYRCKQCGERLCPGCYEDMPFCDEKHQEQFIKEEIADIVYERSHFK